MENSSSTSSNNITKLPQSPRVPIEFLSRSWSASAIIEQTESTTTRKPTIQHKSIAAAATTTTTAAATAALPGERSELDEQINYSQRVLERIFSHLHQQQQRGQGQDGDFIVSPLTSGRPSLSSEPNICGYTNFGGGVGGGCGGGVENAGSGSGSLTATSDSPPISPSQDFHDVLKFLQSGNTTQTQVGGGRSTTVTPSGGGKTVGRWLKDRREKKKEETRAHIAQLHAAVSVAGVAAAVAAIAAASSGQGEPGDQKRVKADTAVASAATLVAAQCVEAAEAMGAERDHLASVISSAVNVRSYDDIVTLTAAAATALRGAATLKARALKDAWSNNAAVETPLQRAMPPRVSPGTKCYGNDNYTSKELDGYTQEFLARGCEILKRTRKGDLHWKIISVYLHRSGQVMLKMKSRHIAGTVTKKKKNVVVEVYKHTAPWPGRKHVLEGREQRCYFGLRTQVRGVVEFECRNQKEHDMWTLGVSNLLAIVAERKCRR